MKKVLKRLCSFLLTVTMVISLLPTGFIRSFALDLNTAKFTFYMYSTETNKYVGAFTLDAESFASGWIGKITFSNCF